MHAEDPYEQFRLTFEKFYDPLCRYASSYVKKESMCEDIVQEVFARIWERHRDMIPSDKIRFYLFTAVRNNCLTYLTREKKRGVVSFSDLDFEDDDIIADTGTLSGEIVNYQALLGKGIALLPAKCKTVFLLSRMGGLSSREVADHLGISVKTVNNQLWKALKLLKAFARNRANCL